MRRFRSYSIPVFDGDDSHVAADLAGAMRRDGLEGSPVFVGAATVPGVEVPPGVNVEVRVFSLPVA